MIKSAYVNYDISIWGSNSVCKLNIDGFVYDLVPSSPAKMPGWLAKYYMQNIIMQAIGIGTYIQPASSFCVIINISCAQRAFFTLLLPFG